MSKSIKLYSERAVLLSAFLGGTLTAGILMRRNSINLGRRKEGNLLLLAGILIMAGWAILASYELRNPYDNLLKFIVPMLNVAVAKYFTTEYHGPELHQHTEQKLPFYSMWRAASIGMAFVAIVMSMIIYGNYVEKTSFDYETFQNLETEFLKNQNVVDQIENFTMYKEQRLNFIDLTALPTLNRNIELCQKMLAVRLVPEDLRTHIGLLEQLTRLQIEKCNLVKNEHSTGEWVQDELIDVLERIDEVVAKLNADSE